MFRKRLFILAAILLFFHPVLGFRSPTTYKNNQQQQQRRSSYYGGTQNEYSASNQKLGQEDNSAKAEAKVNKGVGLSAWGIIAIILAVIVLSTGGYYVFVLYPYICKKERSYDMIELANVV